MADLTLEQAIKWADTMADHYDDGAWRVVRVLAAAVRAQQARTCETCRYRRLTTAPTIRAFCDRLKHTPMNAEWCDDVKFCGAWAAKKGDHEA